MKFTNKELGLLIYGLRAVHVADLETEQRALLKKLEEELSVRGLKVPADGWT